MSNPIENAANRIAFICNAGLPHNAAEKAVELIIREELFPVVKHEDVQDEQFYAYESCGRQFVDTGDIVKFIGSDAHNIRGPIPMPPKAG